MSEKVLITGVSGFIGSNLLDYLLQETSWDIVGIDNLSTGSYDNIVHNISNSRFSFKECNCSDITSLTDFTKIFHLAALPRIQPSFQFINDHIKANLLETTYLIELMIKENYFPKFVYSGSSAIYGTPTHFPTDEHERVECLSPYAFQKYEVERYLELIGTRYPLNYIILRYFNPYGPRSFNPKNKFNAYSSVVGIFMFQKQNGQSITITGNGEQKRDFIHVKDVAKANYLASLTEPNMNEIFNIGSGTTYTVLDLARMISDNYVFIDKREGEADITWAEIKKAKNLLKWEPTETLVSYIDNFE